MPVGEPRRHQRSRLLANILKACHPAGRICVTWLHRMNAIDPTVSQDGLTRTSAAQHAASSIRTGASGLPSAAEIWATGAEASSQTTEEASARPGKITEKVVLGPEPAMAAEPDSIRQNSIRQNSVGKSGVQVQAGLAEGRPWPPRRLSLALQGGGSFGAFTWGVLDRLLEEPNCDLNSISGASAGAVNGVLLAAGFVEGGREGARARLRRFWRRITDEASFRSLMLIGGFSPAGTSVAFGRGLSPTQFDPIDLDPLRQALAMEIDFSLLSDPTCPKLLVATTRVRDGRLHIFRNRDLTADVMLASTCPPLIHCAVEIEGEAYWDGGYAANPPVVQLVQDSEATDVLVVQITPTQDTYIPMTMAAIDRRLDQIMANSSLNAEIAALDLARNDAATPKLRSLRLFRIAAEDTIDGLAQRSAVDLGRSFITMLHRSGRDAADRWLSRDPDGTAPAVARRSVETFTA
jgi:NTE family protein